jgi:hypothetical protein
MTTSSYESHDPNQSAYLQCIQFFASILDGSDVNVAVRGKFLEERGIRYFIDLSLREEDLVVSAVLQHATLHESTQQQFCTSLIDFSWLQLLSGVNVAMHRR